MNVGAAIHQERQNMGVVCERRIRFALQVQGAPGSALGGAVAVDLRGGTEMRRSSADFLSSNYVQAKILFLFFLFFFAYPPQICSDCIWSAQWIFL